MKKCSLLHYFMKHLSEAVARSFMKKYCFYVTMIKVSSLYVIKSVTANGLSTTLLLH